jgi:L-alanine-DL-glutamate epimerase-like enolase superfamily enzyme
MITGVDVFAHSVSYAHGEYVMSGGRSAARQTSTLVRLTTDDGLEGWGEVTPLGATYLPTSTSTVRAALELLATHLLGLDPVNVLQVNRVMDGVLLGHPYAKSPVDIACWDLRGKILDASVATLLGGVTQDTYPVYEPVPLRSPDEMAAYVRTRRAAGIKKFQLKVGNSPRDDIARTEAAVSAADDETLIVADSNGGWNLLDARMAVKALGQLPILIEQPCRTTDDCVLAVRESNLPLVLDESILNLDDVLTAKYRASAVAINVKLSRVGGITKAARFRDLIQELGMMITVEDMWGGDIVSTAVSHVAASTAPESLLMSPLLNELTSDGFIAGHVPQSVDGRASAPTGPGLGIEIDSGDLGEPLFSLRR